MQLAEAERAMAMSIVHCRQYSVSCKLCSVYVVFSTQKKERKKTREFCKVTEISSKDKKSVLTARFLPKVVLKFALHEYDV
jgi:hypothetical protein